MAVLKKSLNKKQAVKLKIPAEPDFISLARLILAAQLRQNKVDEEEIEDLKIVLSELLAKAIEAKIVGKCMALEIFFDNGTVELLVTNLDEFKPEELFSSPFLNFEVIKSLVDDFDLILSAENQGFSVRITKRFHF